MTKPKEKERKPPDLHEVLDAIEKEYTPAQLRSLHWAILRHKRGNNQ